MKQLQYLALLRGINVGGNNIIKMVDLKACFENMGLRNVATFIQSGNVLFSSPEKNIEKLTKRIEQALSKQFNYKSRVAVVSHDQLDMIVKAAPKGFGKEPARFRYDVMFLLYPLTVQEVVGQISLKTGVDHVFAGKDVVYFSRLISKASQSHLPRMIKLPMYKNLTIRNWNTTTKLLMMMDKNV